MKPLPRQISATAPASIGNVGVGFDVLGLAFDAVRDRVTAHASDQPGIRLGKVSGLVDRLPEAVEANCALAAAEAVRQRCGAQTGLVLDIHKGVPMSAGMGGSAASAVAAAGAANLAFDAGLDHDALLLCAMEGERVSADPPPWDNVMAALYGGLVLAARLDPPLIRPLPAPDGLSCILFHPARKIETQAARDLLAPTAQLGTAVEHSRHMASFVAGCTLQDLDMIEAGLRDILIEPQRLPLLPELAAVQQAARSNGALGCSFSGSGPSVFALARSADLANVKAAMADAFQAAGCPATAYEAPLVSAGLEVETFASPARVI
ncbi:MAG: homoserine kinase [Alphaproteobacteria bacterium]|nr:homoserine kinase [Alphaproteobacteria bacterium]